MPRRTPRRSTFRSLLRRGGRYVLPGLLLTASPALAQTADPQRPPLLPPVRTAFLYLPTPGETGGPGAALKERSRDRWLGPDKAQHAAISFLWTLGSQYTLVNKGALSERRALPFSIASSALLGLSKEMYDWKAGPHRSFSHRDLAADAFGIALAVTLILL